MIRSRRYFAILATLLTLSVGRSATATEKVCVLNFERPEHGITKVLSTVFSRAPDTEVRNLATPNDLLDCIRGGSEEIVVVAHALQDPNNPGDNSPVNLAYFREAEPGEVTNPEPSQTAYVMRTFLPRAMQRIRAELQAQTQAGRLQLKKLRWMSCMPQKVFATYREFGLAMQENSIAVDFAPKNELMSLVYGEDMVSPDLEWLTKGIDCSRLQAWRTERNNNCREDWWPGCNRKTARICFPQ